MKYLLTLIIVAGVGILICYKPHNIYEHEAIKLKENPAREEDQPRNTINDWYVKGTIKMPEEQLKEDVPRAFNNYPLLFDGPKIIAEASDRTAYRYAQ